MTPASANDDAWTVVESSGQVRSADDGAGWAWVRSGDVLPPGVTIETGANGRLKLVRNGDTLDVSPDSQMQVDNGRATGDANVGVILGTVLFKVETRPEYSFGVKTPYMAAVIKGTTFTVTVNPQGAALHVIEGAVQVSSLDTNHVALVRPGQTATVPSAPGAGMQVIEGSASYEPETDGDSGNDAAEVDTDGTGEATADASQDGSATPAKKAAAKSRAAQVVTEGRGPTGQPAAVVERGDKPKTAKVKITNTVGRGVGNYLTLSNGLLGNADAVGNASFNNAPGQAKKMASAEAADGSVKQSNGNGSGNANASAKSGGSVASVSSPSAVSTSNAGGVSSGVSNAGGVSSSVSSAGGVASSVSSAGGVASSVSSAGGAAAGSVTTSNAGGAAAGVVTSNAGGAAASAAAASSAASNAGGAAAAVVIPNANAGGNGNGNSNAGGNGNGNGNGKGKS